MNKSDRASKNSKKLQLGVIFGGRSGEHEISLMSARSVLSVLDPTKYQVTQVGITIDGSWYTGEDVLQALWEIGLQKSQPENKLGQLTPVFFPPDPKHCGLFALHSMDGGSTNHLSSSLLLEFLGSLDVVFPVLHGTFGEDGTLQGLLEMANVAYVGAGVLGSAVGMDKGLFVDVMRANAIPVVETLVVLRSQITHQFDHILNKAEALAPYPLFTKPANLGSSVGVSKCRNRSDLVEGLMDAARYDRRILIQRGIDAREIEVSVLGNDEPVASIPGEIIPSREFYSYEAKYVDDASELLIPAPIPPETVELAKELALRAYRAIDAAGMARVDFLLDKVNGELYLNEVNTIPGFTKISMYPKLWEASGLPYPQLVDRLIELAVERRVEQDRTEHRYQRNR